MFVAFLLGVDERALCKAVDDGDGCSGDDG